MKVFRCVSSTAQLAAVGELVCTGAAIALKVLCPEDEAMQYCALLLTQKTSLQQAVTPRLGALVNEPEGRNEDVRGSVEEGVTD